VKPALAFVASSPVAVPAQPVVVPQAQMPARRPSYAELSRAPRRRLLLVGIAALHVLALLGLSRMQDVRRTIAHVAPVVVRLIEPAEPPKPQPQPPVEMPKLNVPAPTMIDPPLIAVAAPPAPAPVFAALPTPPPTPVVVQPAPTPVVQATPQPPAIKHIPASAVRYLRPPNTAVPLMSRRLKESGIVYLRVVVDINGMPREITLSKSSGFTRLDEQALLDMRTARFVPYTENGQPVEWEVIAPMSYEVDR
jgi:protein TonB